MDTNTNILVKYEIKGSLEIYIFVVFVLSVVC